MYNRRSDILININTLKPGPKRKHRQKESGEVQQIVRLHCISLLTVIFSETRFIEVMETVCEQMDAYRTNYWDPLLPKVQPTLRSWSYAIFFIYSLFVVTKMS